jgi:hypothetical protein
VVIERRSDLVERLYAPHPDPDVIVVVRAGADR